LRTIPADGSWDAWIVVLPLRSATEIKNFPTKPIEPARFLFSLMRIASELSLFVYDKWLVTPEFAVGKFVKRSA
jgi:hypothetical protein